MGYDVGSIYKDIIKKYENGFTKVVVGNLVHGSLEYGGA